MGGVGGFGVARPRDGTQCLLWCFDVGQHESSRASIEHLHNDPSVHSLLGGQTNFSHYRNNVILT